jgi:two-component system sensor histidine kinase BaeS
VKLRTRLFVTSLAVVVPLALSLMWLADRERYSGMEQSLRQSIDAEIARGTVDLCAAGRPGPPGGRGLPGRPEGPPGERDGLSGGRIGPPGPGAERGGRGGRGGPPAELHFYGADFTPVDSHAPAMPEDLRRALGRSDEATSTYPTEDGPGVTIAMRVVDAAGPCPILIARMRPRPGQLRDQRVALGMVVASVLAVAWIAAFPVIARMRRLAAGVHASAASKYERPIELGGSSRDELADLARAFNTAGASVRQHLVDVQSRQEPLRQFVANTTHDVAMPLTVLQGHLAELERATPTGSSDQMHVRDAIQEAHYLGSLIRNLGAASRLDADSATLDLRDVDLSALVDRVVTRHRTLARARQVALDYATPEHPPAAQADVTLLEQAVSNLVDNAVQYANAGGHVAVVLDRRGDRFLLTVVDDGPGVGAEELAALTSRRFRGSEARTRRPDGQGLGLSIAAEAIARLGFTLRFRRPDSGGLAAEIEGSLAAR